MSREGKQGDGSCIYATFGKWLDSINTLEDIVMYLRLARDIKDVI